MFSEVKQAEWNNLQISRSFVHNCASQHTVATCNSQLQQINPCCMFQVSATSLRAVAREVKTVPLVRAAECHDSTRHQRQRAHSLQHYRPRATRVPTARRNRAPYISFRHFWRKIDLVMEAVRTSETSVNNYQTAWGNILEDSFIIIVVRIWNLTYT
jgi:hypothetical protein